MDTRGLILESLRERREQTQIDEVKKGKKKRIGDFKEEDRRRDSKGRFTTTLQSLGDLDFGNKIKKVYPNNIEKETNAKGKPTVAEKFRVHYEEAILGKELHNIKARRITGHAYDMAAQRDVPPKQLGDLFDGEVGSYAYPEKIDSEGRKSKKIKGDNDAGVVLGVDSGAVVTILNKEDLEKDLEEGAMSMGITLTKQQADFIESELGLSFVINESVQMDRPMMRQIKEYALDVEVFEAMDMDENNYDFISSRGSVACGIYDLMSKALREQG